MAGQIKLLLEQIILDKSLGDPVLQRMTKIKLLIKGININDFDDQSPDDPVIILKLCEIAQEFGIESDFFDEFKLLDHLCQERKKPIK